MLQIFVLLLLFFPLEAKPGLISATDYIQSHPTNCLFYEELDRFPCQSHPIEKAADYFAFPPRFVLSIPDGRVVGEKGLVITNENQVLRELAIEWDVAPENHSIFSRNLFGPTLRKGTVASVSSIEAQNYYHWLLDIIPKFQLLEEAHVVPDYYCLNYRGLPFQKATLDILGISLKKIIRATGTTHVQCANLIVPSLPGGCGFQPKKALEFLREKFLPHISSIGKTPERIFISRKNAHVRRVTNEARVSQFLKGYGFQTVCLEELPFLEQVKLFANAQFIVAIHGAGMANLVFASPSAKVIELCPPSYINSCFWRITQQLGMEHFVLIGDQTGIGGQNFRMDNRAMKELELLITTKFAL